MICGNKTDLGKSRIISTEDGCNTVDKFGTAFIETSSKEGTNIDELFTLIASKIVDKKSLL